MLDALHAYLYYSSVFSDMKIKEAMSFDYIINGLCMMFTQFLAKLLKTSQFLLEKSWEFLQFGSFENKNYGKNNSAADLYEIFSTYIWIPIIISLLVLAVYFFVSSKGSEKLKRFSLNLVTLVVVMALLPSVFTYINVNVFHNYKDDLLSIDSETTAEKIFYKHTTDYLYIYKKYAKPLEKEAKKYSGNFKSFTKEGKPVSSLLYILTKKDSQGNYKLLSSNVSIASGKYKGKHYKNQMMSWNADAIDKYSNFKNLDKFDVNETIVTSGTLASDSNVDDEIESEGSTAETDPRAEENTEINGEEEAPEFLQIKLRDGTKAVLANIITKKVKNKSVDSINNALIDKISGFGDRADVLLTSLNDWTEETGIITGLFNQIAKAVLGREYFRYRVDFACIWIEMLANIFLYFAVSFALLKIVWEIIVNRIFLGYLAAIDLTGGDKIKRALNGLLGLYVSVMFVGFSIVLYNNACDFIRNTLNVSGLTYVIIVFMLASIALDTPNIIAKYFGIETGMRAGGTMIKRIVGTAIGAGVMAARTASMNHRFRKSNSARAAAATGNYQNASSLQKMMHPITYGKGRIFNAVDTKVQKASEANRRSATLDKGNVLQNIEKSDFAKASGMDYGKHAKPSGTRYDTLGGFSTEKKDVQKKNPTLSNEQVEKLANQKQADKFSGVIQKQAMLDQASSIANGKLENNVSSLNSALNKINKDNDNRLFSKKADVNEKTAQYMNQDRKFNSYKETAFEDISANAKKKNSNPSMNDYLNSARTFAGPNASQETVEVLANQTYAFDNAIKINDAAARYQKSQADMEKLTLSEARTYIMSNNNDYFSTPINPKYAKDISIEMEKRGFSNKEPRNLGARKFTGK